MVSHGCGAGAKTLVGRGADFTLAPGFRTASVG